VSQDLTVSAFRDEAAGVWVATSDDVLGLATEAVTLDELYGRVLAVTPELLRDNGVAPDAGTINLTIVISSALP